MMSLRDEMLQAKNEAGKLRVENKELQAKVEKQSFLLDEVFRWLSSGCCIRANGKLLKRTDDSIEGLSINGKPECDKLLAEDKK